MLGSRAAASRADIPCWASAAALLALTNWVRRRFVLAGLLGVTKGDFVLALRFADGLAMQGW